MAGAVCRRGGSHGTSSTTPGRSRIAASRPAPAATSWRPRAPIAACWQQRGRLLHTCPVESSGVHHVALCVDDLDAALAFYTGTLGLAVRDGRPDLAVAGFWLQAGEQQVHLIEGPPGRREGYHFALARGRHRRSGRRAARQGGRCVRPGADRRRPPVLPRRPGREPDRAARGGLKPAERRHAARAPSRPSVSRDNPRIRLVRDEGMDRVVTVPNLVTVSRLVLLGVFCFLLFGPDQRVAASIVLMVTGFTDFLDGYVARRFDQVIEARQGPRPDGRPHRRGDGGHLDRRLRRGAGLARRRSCSVASSSCRRPCSSSPRSARGGSTSSGSARPAPSV